VILANRCRENYSHADLARLTYPPVAFPADRDKLGEADGLDMSFQTSLERVEIRVETPRSVRKR
jgi:hypothetical protein